MPKNNNSARPNRKSSGAWSRPSSARGRGKSSAGGRGRDGSTSRGQRDWNDSRGQRDWNDSRGGRDRNDSRERSDSRGKRDWNDSRGKRDWSSRQQWGSEGYRPAGRSRRHDNDAWNEEGRRRFEGDSRDSRDSRGGRYDRDNRGGRWNDDNRDRRGGPDRRRKQWDDRNHGSDRKPWRRDEREDRDRSRGWGRDDAPDARGERRSSNWTSRTGSRAAWKREGRDDRFSGGGQRSSARGNSYRGGQRRDDCWRDDNDRDRSRGGRPRSSSRSDHFDSRSDRYDSRDDRPRSHGYRDDRARSFGQRDDRSRGYNRDDRPRSYNRDDERRGNRYDRDDRSAQRDRSGDERRGNRYDRDTRSDDRRGNRDDRSRSWDRREDRDQRSAHDTPADRPDASVALQGDEVLDGLTSRMEAAKREKFEADKQKSRESSTPAQDSADQASSPAEVSADLSSSPAEDSADRSSSPAEVSADQQAATPEDSGSAPATPSQATNDQPDDESASSAAASSEQANSDNVNPEHANPENEEIVNQTSVAEQATDESAAEQQASVTQNTDQPAIDESTTSEPATGRPDDAPATANRRRESNARTEHPHGAVRREERDDDRVEPVRRQKGRTRFSELGVPQPIVEELDSQGILAPFPIQQAAIPDALSGRDVLGRGQTGSGKTLAFGIPVITRLAASGTGHGRQPRALLMAPTRELAQQVNDVLFPLAKAMGLSTILVAGGMSYTPQLRALERGVDIVVATPGRLIDLIERGSAKLGEVQEVVLDEADEMADMGFMPDVTRILDEISREAQHLLFSATLDRQVDTIVRRYMHDPVEHGVDSAKASVTTMRHELWTVNARDKAAIIAQAANRPGRTLVFVRTQRDADRTAEQLRDLGLMAGALHGGLPQGMRARVLYAFRQGRVPVLVATDVAARGIDVDDVSLVLQADPPHDSKDYLHRAGRTARAGEDGLVATLVLPRARGRMARIMRDAGVNERPHPMRPGDRLEELTGGTEPHDEPVREEQYRAIIAPPRPVKKRGGGHYKGKPWQRRKSSGRPYKRG